MFQNGLKITRLSCSLILPSRPNNLHIQIFLTLPIKMSSATVFCLSVGLDREFITSISTPVNQRDITPEFFPCDISSHLFDSLSTKDASYYYEFCLSMFFVWRRKAKYLVGRNHLILNFNITHLYFPTTRINANVSGMHRTVYIVHTLYNVHHIYVVCSLQ